MKMYDLNEHLEEVQEQLDYEFNNTHLLLQAFTRSSYSAQYGGENNEVLEFIGDRVLDFYVVKTIADEFGFFREESEYYDGENNEFCIIANKNEADFTNLKKEIVNNKTLARRIDKLKLARYMYLGDSDLSNNVTNQEKVKADLFEAIIGAIAIDCEWNQEILQDEVNYLIRIDDFLEDIDTEEERPAKFQLENAVNTLKELAEHGQCSIPEYDQSEERGLSDSGELMWACRCSVWSWGIRKIAYATSKKAAKRYSAYLVLCEQYGISNEYEEEEEYE